MSVQPNDGVWDLLWPDSCHKMWPNPPAIRLGPIPEMGRRQEGHRKSLYECL